MLILVPEINLTVIFPATDRAGSAQRSVLFAQHLMMVSCLLRRRAAHGHARGAGYWRHIVILADVADQAIVDEEHDTLSP